MKHFTFGRNNGLRVSQLSLGTVNFGTGWGYGTDVDSSRHIVDAFADAGGTLIDTAQSYQGGEAEEALGVAWLIERARRSTTGVVPIIGPRTVEHLTAYLSTLDTELPPEVYATLDAVSEIDRGEPHGQIAERLELARGGAGNWRRSAECGCHP